MYVLGLSYCEISLKIEVPEIFNTFDWKFPEAHFGNVSVLTVRL